MGHQWYDFPQTLCNFSVTIYDWIISSHGEVQCVTGSTRWRHVSGRLCSKLTHWRRGEILVSFYGTGKAASRMKGVWIRWCSFVKFLFILVPDEGKMTSWTAAAVTLQLCLDISPVDCFSAHLHLESWICDKEPTMSMVQIQTHTQDNVYSCKWNTWRNH